MRPLDPRLLRYAEATRGFLVACVVIGSAVAGLVVVQAFALADIITGVFQDGLGLAQLRQVLVLLVAVIVARAVLLYLAEIVAHRAGAKAKNQLRQGLLAHALNLGPGWLAGRGAGELATLATRGIDGLDAYFARYLPMLVLAVTVPIIGGVAILSQDVLSALIVALTLPLIPVFMILVGRFTQSRVDRQWRTLGVLSGHFLDVVAGLPTLAVFGRAKAQAESIRRIGDQYRLATMKVLRVSFLSSLVLELLATLSVAMIAVGIGLRLVGGGGFTLRAGLVVLILAPEVYLPLRMVGANFHAAAEGLGAAERVLDILETPVPPRGERTDVPDPARSSLVVRELTVAYPDRPVPALAGVSMEIRPGVITAITGPSGCGKSTLLAVLMGFVAPTAGEIRLAGEDLAEFDVDVWRESVGYVPQVPHLLTRSLRENVALGRPDASDEEILAALTAAGADGLAASLPAGLDTVVGEAGRGLSAGQTRRVALARALVRDCPLLLLDEPTAALDAATEAAALANLVADSRERTVVVVAHRPALLAIADVVIELPEPPPEAGALPGPGVGVAGVVT